jgi:hypothetical protein
LKQTKANPKLQSAFLALMTFRQKLELQDGHGRMNEWIYPKMKGTKSV